MNAATQAKMEEIVKAANAGYEIIPAFFQPIWGQSNTVSAAIRAAKKLGLIVEAGVDGSGKPKYRAAPITTTHTGSAAIN